MYLGVAILAGQETVSAAGPPRPEAAVRSYCARRSRDSYSAERQGLRSRVICTDTYLWEDGEQPVNALTAHLADLQKPDGLDTRAVYLIQACFGSSQTRSA